MELLDYASRGALFFTGFSLFMMLILFILEIGSNIRKNENRKSARITATITFIFIIFCAFIDAKSNYSTLMENKKSFEIKEYLECYSGFNTYLVAKDRGWQRDGDYFIKGDYIINALNCKISEVQSKDNTGLSR